MEIFRLFQFIMQINNSCSKFEWIRQLYCTKHNYSIETIHYNDMMALEIEFTWDDF